eukprot:TRINITY_DN10303_c0_g2_i1.p1 TRINITY_DN10303_c0_g2~~TRINITY_DN10303_c0_g2_i1.p1  ORF type:complete len:633 (+),score=41.27 TRINITY_DN10303_c0_g2_i1:89-1987(+)
MRFLSHVFREVGRWREELQCRWSAGINIAFDGEEEEAGFVRHLAPQVAKWTLLGHGMVFLISAITFIWNVASIHFDSSWDQFDSNVHLHRSRYVLLMLTCFGVHLLAVAALIAAYYARVSAERWELISVSATSLFVIMLPWLDPWHGISLVGGEPKLVWGPGVEEYEALRILCIMAGVQAYALYVPIRWRYCFVVPLCCSISIMVLVCTVGSPYEASIPFKLPLIAFLLLSPAVGQRSHEVLVRERWLALQQISERSDELLGMQAMSGVLCDVTFKLNSAFRFVGSDSFRDAFFSSAVEGTSILGLMSEADQDRFIDSMSRTPATHVPVSIPVSLKRKSGLADVTLFLVRAHKGLTEGDPKFLVSLMVSQEESVLEETNDDFQSTSITLPSSTLTSLPPLAEFDPIVPTRADRKDSRKDSATISDLSFTYSADSPLVVTLNEIAEVDGKPQIHASAASNALSSKDLVSIESAQMSERVATREVAVNTAWVWHNNTFMCSSCAKPPKLPGPLPRVPRRASKQQKKQQKQYEGTSFDGAWALRATHTANVPDWLRYLDIEGSHVVLGDLRSATITVGESSGEFILCSGRIWIDDDGALVRKGHSERILYYDPQVLSDDEDAESDRASIMSIPLS